jgi:hypothetical protein
MKDCDDPTAIRDARLSTDVHPPQESSWWRTRVGPVRLDSSTTTRSDRTFSKKILKL